ncbi:ComEC/Rec2 family competence protein [Pseudotabrizicola sp.]|uniref:ComEC/Rec2 family competence protein n=1 Tax=Pseudotabrizicola sp. TaxID=2939647 RepID=UPI0027173479|nr:ComEC/Rec2 family competence protein [Pseudotabrizicola sp.]MDO8881992.1 ComEC/Rec2 family competence protein [Pseudotabrizicola sp.]
MAVLTGLLMRPLNALAQARGTLFPWVPLLIGVGIGGWFSLSWEPGWPVYALAAAVVALCLALRLWGPEAGHPFVLAVACVALGVLACGLRVQMVQAPMLDFRYYGPVTGRVIKIDRSQTDALRITLDRLQLDRVRPSRMPERVRISLRGKVPGHAPFPGEVVMVTATLQAPDGPIEPGSFDFRRMAFFDRLGAVGYTTAPVVLWEPAPEGGSVAKLRRDLALALMREVPGDAGGFIAGIMTGDRSGLSRPAVQALRDTNMAHLLAISGMHMAFLTGFVFAGLRMAIAAVPPLALRVNGKKLAALVSLAVAAFYLALSGANVATERAFIMVSVMLGAVLLDRKALTLRSVAIAGVILLLWQPETMQEPGFQMSFAATVALIAGFRAVDRRVVAGHLPTWAMPVFTLVLSSVIGGFATAPYAAAHFNRFADYGLIANLLAVPVMGSVVMPAGAVAGLLAPFGLAGLPLWVMEQGAAWIIWVAHWVAGWNGAVTAIPAPGPWVLPLVTLAGAFVVLLRGAWRGLFVAPAVAALVLWVGAERPLVLISADGGLVGVIGADGRALSAPSGAGFAAQNWLENDGDMVSQEQAAARAGMQGPVGARRFDVAGLTGMALKGKGALALVEGACAGADFVVVSVPVPDVPEGCLLLGPERLRNTGTLALYPVPGGLRPEPSFGARRVWSSPRRPEGLAAVIGPKASRVASGQ